jgi:hypothetical protein
MTDLRDQLARLLDNEPEAPYDIDRVLRTGRRARRRHKAALAAAGTLGAAGLTAAVVIPVVAAGGDGTTVHLGVRPSPSPTQTRAPATAHCYLIAAPRHDVSQAIQRLVRTGRVGTHPSVKHMKGIKGSDRTVLEVCTKGTSPGQPRQSQPHTQLPAGPPYHYTDQPEAIASRLGDHLHDRVSSFGLSITYTRPFSQESSTLDRARPRYYGGNVDIHETRGYGDIGVQVTHGVSQLVPFTGACTAARHCTETELPDGSVLRTGQANAGPGHVVLTAEVHRPDGVVVQAQESNYPFGPDAGSQPGGDQPLTLDQLISLAEDGDFTF